MPPSSRQLLGRLLASSNALLHRHFAVAPSASIYDRLFPSLQPKSFGLIARNLLHRPLTTTSPSSLPPNDSTPRIQFVKDEAYLTLNVGNSRTTFRVYEDRPISNLLAALQEEDPTLTIVSIRDGSGPTSARWARSTIGSDILEVAMKKGELALDLDGQTLSVKVQPLHERLEPLQQDIDSLVRELQPLQERKYELDAAANNRASMVSWFGLIWLCAQLGVMIRLTWWEYSWDVMEPISYVLSAATGIMAYWFFVLTRKEYTYEVLHEITMSNAQRAIYARKKFDFHHYTEIREKIRELSAKMEQLHELYGVEEYIPPKY